MNEKLAKNTIELMMRCGGEIDNLLGQMKKECEPEEFERLHKLCAEVMGAMYSVMHELFNEHPSLIPPEILDEDDSASG